MNIDESVKKALNIIAAFKPGDPIHVRQQTYKSAIEQITELNSIGDNTAKDIISELELICRTLELSIVIQQAPTNRKSENHLAFVPEEDCEAFCTNSIKSISFKLINNMNEKPSSPSPKMEPWNNNVPNTIEHNTNTTTIVEKKDSFSNPFVHPPTSPITASSPDLLPVRSYSTQQCVITTDLNCNVLLANNVFTLVTGFQTDDIIGKKITNYMAEPNRKLIHNLIERKNQLSTQILTCGKMIRLVRRNGSTVSVSLWLERRTGNNEAVYIWIMDTLDEYQCIFFVNKEAQITSFPEHTSKTITCFSEYKEDELIHAHISRILPRYADMNIKTIIETKTSSAGFITKSGQMFQVALRISQFAHCNNSWSVELSSTANISGMMIVNSERTITTANHMFFKFLFGRSSKDMSGASVSLSATLPDIDDLLRLNALSQYFETVNTYAVHVDGSRFPVRVGIRKMQGHSTNASWSLWISHQYKGLDCCPFQMPVIDINDILSSPTTANDLLVEINTPTGLTINDFDLVIKPLGEGAYGIVKLGCLKSDITRQKYVIKCIKKNALLTECWSSDRKRPIEIDMLLELKDRPHPNIISLAHHFEDVNFFYFTSPLHGEGQDLFEFIEKNPFISEFKVQKIFLQIVDAIRHLHLLSIVHRDIKDENVIIDKNLNIKLIDFGSAAYYSSGKTFSTFYGTIDYASPEVLTGHQYEGPQQDIWALGILLYTLTFKENPFVDINEIISGKLRVPFKISDDHFALIQWMLQKDPQARPKIGEVMTHSWLCRKL